MADKGIVRRRVVKGILAAVVASMVLGAASTVQAAEDNTKAKAKLRVLVLTGGHGYDKKTFPKTFEGHDDIDFKIQDKGSPFVNVDNWAYDVMVLFNFNRKMPEAQRANFLKLLKRGVGLVVMHHAVAAYPGWIEYEKIIGATYALKAFQRDGVKFARPIWKHDVHFDIHVEDKTHPITKGISDFKILDESYKKWTYHPGSHLLLTTENTLNNTQIAWTRFYGKSRVFFMQLGHGSHAFTSKSFQQIIAQGIRWSAGRLPAGPGPDSRKIVFLWSKGHHPNDTGSRLLAHCLANSSNVKEIKSEVHENWPADPNTLKDAAAIVLYSEGTNKKGKPHPILTPDRIKQLDALAERGAGIVFVHYSLYATREVEAPKLLNWVGAYYDFQGYGSKHGVSRKPLTCSPVKSLHHVLNGWKAFTLKENELYHNLKFADSGITPILTAPFGGGAGDKSNIVGWSFVRKDGGRGFGFGGGHFYSMWLDESCRRMMLNGIVWAAKLGVPADGVQSTVPDAMKTVKSK